MHRRLMTVVVGALLFATLLFGCCPHRASCPAWTAPSRLPTHPAGRTMSWDDPARYDADIARALATPGGHLSIGRGGFTLHYENARLGGCDCETIKAAASRPVCRSSTAGAHRSSWSRS